MLLHPSRPPDGVKNTESEATQRAGASPLPPLDITLACAGTSNPPLSTPLSRARGPPNPLHGSTLRTRFRKCRQGSKECPTPRDPYQAARPPPWFESSRCLPLRTSRRPQARRPKMSPAPSFDAEPHREGSAVLKTPPRSAAGQVHTGCRCRKRRHSTLSRTALEIATQHQAPRNAASSRNNSRVKTPGHQQESRRLGVRWATPFFACPTTDCHHRPK